MIIKRNIQAHKYGLRKHPDSNSDIRLPVMRKRGFF